MPELPEIETVKNSLAPILTGRKLLSITANRPNLRYLLPNFKVASNSVVHTLSRRAKYLLLSLDIDYVILIHLGMSGRLIIDNEEAKNNKHNHVIFQFEGVKLVYCDPRRFGMVDLIAKSELDTCKYFSKLGIEPLSDDFNAEYLLQVCTKSSTTIKQLIMDNNVVVGVGNIYANESLFLAGIAPNTIAKFLPQAKIIMLVNTIKQVLQKAIQAGGSSMKDFVDGHNQAGSFQQHFAVYGRDGKNCIICSSIIKKLIISGRATYFCPECQEKFEP